MAPMIDMVFLLLVFFMCVSSLSQAAKRAPVALPESTESRVPEDPGDRATVSVSADGSIFLGSEKSDLRQFGAVLKKALASNPRMRIQVRADRTTPFTEIRKVMRACAEAGAVDIIYATHQEAL